MCFRGPDGDGVSASLIDGCDSSTVTRNECVVGSDHKQGGLIWQGWWLTGNNLIVKCRAAPALPTSADRAAVLRRVNAPHRTAPSRWCSTHETVSATTNSESSHRARPATEAARTGGATSTGQQAATHAPRTTAAEPSRSTSHLSLKRASISSLCSILEEHATESPDFARPCHTSTAPERPAGGRCCGRPCPDWEARAVPGRPDNDRWSGQRAG